MKKIFQYSLFFALLCGLGFGVTSCKDDDNNELSEEQKQEQQQNAQAEKSLKFWSVVGQLVSTDNFTNDYENKTFEPSIGSEDANNTQTRVVLTNDAATAALRFAYLVGKDDITEQTPSYTWSDPEVGTLTYTKVTDGTAWAKVDVSIKQVPHLTQIIYRSGNQGDANASGYVANHGRAYYRFGDVISRTDQDGDKEYWVCVRPAFDPEDKGDSHWISVSPLPTSNWFTYTSSTKHEFVLPTGLNTSKEHMQNLAEMLYAIYFPDLWQTHLVNYSKQGLKMFHDFSFDNISLHNKNFWTNVQSGWASKDIAKKVFGKSDTELSRMINLEDGLYLLYAGYSWNTWFSNSPTLYQARYQYTSDGMYTNMHKADYTSVSKQCVFKGHGEKDIVIDISECTLARPYYINAEFFGDSNPRYIVRFALGKELSSTGKYANNQFPISGVTEEYRYYRDVVPETNLDQKPEVTGENDVVSIASNAPEKGTGGSYMMGDVLKDDQGCYWICFNGAAYNKVSVPTAKDNTAWFFSLQGVETTDKAATNIITEEELPEVSLRFIGFLTSLRDAKDPYKFGMAEDTLGTIARHVISYSGVDLRKLYCKVDSTWSFVNYPDKQAMSSSSKSFIFNFAYDDGSRDHQAIARYVFDETQAGSQRGKPVTKSGFKYQNWFSRLYKNYEVYDPNQITLTEDEQSVNMTKWQALWPVTDDKMLLQDAANQAMIDKYAKGDKWQKSPRTEPERDVKPADYLWDAVKFPTTKTTLFKEPVLFMRVMKINDEGGKILNLTSTDGRKFTVRHVQNDAILYKSCFQAAWAGPYSVNSQNLFYLNNQLYKVKQIPGL